MKTLKTCLLAALVVVSTAAVAAPPPGPGVVPPERRAGLRMDGDGEGGPGDFKGPGGHEGMERRMRLMFVVGLADALSLPEAEALKLADKVKGFHERRKPLRQDMHEAMKTLKAAADGDAAAQGKVDAAMTKILDGRAQMAAIDRELYQALARDLNPQKRAQLALFLAHFQKEMRGGPGGGHGGKGRFRHHGGRGAE